MQLSLFEFIFESNTRKGARMKAYIHEEKSRRDAFHTLCLSDLKELNSGLRDVEDGMRLKTGDVGNFEWWYFDVFDPETQNIIKIVVHLGTDPLRSRFFPQLAVSFKTPAGKDAFAKPYTMEHFQASSEKCDLRIKKDVRISVDSSGLIKLLISKPCYYGVFAEGCMKSENGHENGFAIYEHMLFRGRNYFM
jgi:hypothetical protein